VIVGETRAYLWSGRLDDAEGAADTPAPAVR
jgi:hypothetical protein